MGISINKPGGGGGGSKEVLSVNGRQGAVAGLEETTNKDTSAALGSSDAKYPSQKAVKSYVDTKDAELAASIASVETAGTVPVTSNSVTVSPSRNAFQFDGGVKVEDESTNKRTRIRIANEKVWLQHYGAVVGGTGTASNREKIQEALDKASEVNGTVGVVSGEPGSYNTSGYTERSGYALTSPLSATVKAAFHIPKNVVLQGPGAVGTSTQKGFTIACKSVPAGAYLMACKEPSLTYGLVMRNVRLEGEFTPESYGETKTPPEAPDGLLFPGGVVQDCNVVGAVRYGVAFLGNHAGFVGGNIGGWSAIGFPAGKGTGGDNFIMRTIVTGGYCSVHVESATSNGNPMQGYFQRCHFGYGGGPSFYMSNSISNGNNFIEGTCIDNCSFEGGGPLIYDENMLGDVEDLLLIQPSVGINNDGPMGAGIGDVTQPKDALVKCHTLKNLRVVGPEGFLKTCGWDETNGTVIRATGNVWDCDFGDISLSLAKAQAFSKPFMRVTGSNKGNKANALTLPGRNAGGVPIHFRTLASAVRRHDIVRRTGASGSGKYSGAFGGKQFDTAGAVPAGIALKPGESGEIVPVVPITGEGLAAIPVNLAHLGGAESTSSQTIPPPTKTGSTTLSSALDLGEGKVIPRLYTYQSTGATKIPLTTLGDLPTGGTTISISTSVITYTKGVPATEGKPAYLEGCSGGSGSFQAGYPVSRVAKVGSITNFGTAPFGGLKIGSTFVSYLGAKEQGGVKYLYGISSNGGGEIASGTAVLEQSVFKVLGYMGDYPAGPASAYCPNNNAQFAYEAFREDKASQPSTYEKNGVFIGLSRSVGTTPSNQYFVTGGTTLKTEVTLPAATIEVLSTTGFPSTGKCKIGTKEFAYTGITATSFTGCTGGTETFTVGQPITPIAGGQVAAEKPVRARYGTGAENANDKGLAAQSSGPGDTVGFLVGSSVAADEGGKVVIEV